MPCRLLLPLLFLCLTPALHANEAEAETPAAFIKRWASAFTSNASEKMLAFYEPSKETEVIISAGLRFQGSEAISKLYYEAQQEVKFRKSNVTKIHSRILGETAVVTFEHAFETEAVADKSVWRGHVRTSTVLRRVKNTWNIVLEHSSPIDGVDRIRRIQQ